MSTSLLIKNPHYKKKLIFKDKELLKTLIFQKLVIRITGRQEPHLIVKMRNFYEGFYFGIC